MLAALIDRPVATPHDGSVVAPAGERVPSLHYLHQWMLAVPTDSPVAIPLDGSVAAPVEERVPSPRHCVLVVLAESVVARRDGSVAA